MSDLNSKEVQTVPGRFTGNPRRLCVVDSRSAFLLTWLVVWVMVVNHLVLIWPAANAARAMRQTTSASRTRNCPFQKIAEWQKKMGQSVSSVNLRLV